MGAKCKVGGELWGERLLRLFFLIALFSVFVASASAQTDRQYIRSGNKLYRSQKFDKAEIEYRKALDKNSANAEALYNMGCSKMMQENDSIALDYFEKAAQAQKDKRRKAQVFHNTGVILQNHQDYAKAIEAYKASLRNNPADNETRYNLALCQKLLKKQQQNQQNQDKDQQNQDKKDNQNKENKKNKNQDQNKDKKQDQDKNKDNQQENGQNQQQDPQQSKQEKINKENAEQMLNAAKNAERAVQEKVKRAQQRRQNTSRQKNW